MKRLTLLLLACLPLVAHGGVADYTVYAFLAQPVCERHGAPARCKLKMLLALDSLPPPGDATVRRYLLQSPWLTAEYVNNELHISCGEHMRCVWVDRE